MTTNSTPRIAGDARGCLFSVVSDGQTAPMAFLSMVLKAKAREVFRIAGGCKGLPPEFQGDNLLKFFEERCKLVDAAGQTTREYKGTAFSGGTANADKETGELKNDMVTNVPAHLCRVYECVAISTTPRTAEMALDPRAGGVVVDGYGGRVDHRQHAAMVFQADPSKVLDWDGDLNLYLGLMEGWQSAGFATAIIVMNGGDVTRREIFQALQRRIPVVLIEGSGRECDGFIKAFRDGDTSVMGAETRKNLAAKGEAKAAALATHNAEIEQCIADLPNLDKSLVDIVPLNDAQAFRDALVARGFFSVE